MPGAARSCSQIRDRPHYLPFRHFARALNRNRIEVKQLCEIVHAGGQVVKNNQKILSGNQGQIGIVKGRGKVFFSFDAIHLP